MQYCIFYLMLLWRLHRMLQIRTSHRRENGIDLFIFFCFFNDLFFHSVSESFPTMSPSRGYLFKMRSTNGSGIMFPVPLFCHFSCTHYHHPYIKESPCMKETVPSSCNIVAKVSKMNRYYHSTLKIATNYLTNQPTNQLSNQLTDSSPTAAACMWWEICLA